mgnify:CR=1 FL=1
MILEKTKIVIGTSRLGWSLNKQKKNKILSVIEYSLNKGIPLHTSTLYGNTINELKKNFFPLDKYLKEIFLKVSFSNKSNFIHQIFYATKCLGYNQKLNVQIDEYFDYNKLEELESALKYFNKTGIINKIYLTPLKINSENYLKNNLYKKFNLALHFSLIEREFENSLIQNNNLDILSIRSLGRGPENFLFDDYNKENLLVDKKKESDLENIILKNKLSKIEARSQYILKNPKIKHCAISTSNISHLDQLIQFENQPFSESIWQELDHFSKTISKHDIKKKIKKNKNNNNFFIQNNLIDLTKILKDLFVQKIIKINYILYFFLFIPLNIFNVIKLKLKIIIYYFYKKFL